VKPPASLFRAVEPSPGATAPSGVAAFPAADSGEPSRRIRWPRLAVIVVAVLALAAAGRLLYAPSAGVALYRVARVERGPLTATVSATGTLNAVVTVQVGSQSSGQIRELHADFNAIVKKGQLIARIDPAPFQAAVDQARADVDNALAARRTEEAAVEKARAEVENAKAAVAVARANTAKAQVAVVDARRDLGRKSDLLKAELIAQADKDTAQTVFDSAQAQREANGAQEKAAESMVRSAAAAERVAEAQLQAARATLRQKEAALAQARFNLDRTAITAPVDGVIVSRNVDVGQTVAASLQAPVLFTIAQDLTRMQVDTNVDEADVGRVRIAQAASFTVDSFPTRVFTGEVNQIRKAPQTLQNVVTYDVVVLVRNPEQTLLPGMTANVKIVTETREAVLKVPNAALRFRPANTADDAGAPARPAAGPTGAGGSGSRGGRDGAGVGRVWVLGPSGAPTPVRVRTGISDGAMTEVLGGALREAQNVVVGPAGGAATRAAVQPGTPRLRL
jgi:HlyD family secretion protein